MPRLVGTLVAVLWTTVAATGEPVAVIVHPAVPIETVSKSALLDLTTGDKTFWPDRSPVVLFDLQGNDEVRRAYYGFLGIRSSRVKSIWLKRMLSGDAEPPESFASQDEMRRRVQTTPGALGFVDRSLLTDEILDRGEVRILLLIEDDTDE